ncbi:uncharacterized protein MYCFIDRAFT_170195 [Pseudocercospora fijiensis CIRAD86]|uniref:F-box domain-containing protein n=1 Tax=Pseudocercospora fijiensis (strain CIRAD86) TaxID=383855 RepID=N1Q7G5_PSEFD|nr:uncharacterized protein MYCFIDRAFT_170195 [Pseudocercospora fijiensis CIRAD86]EME88609.1 hypothetical protein MYCFIDRAFT_170195 [Pseudocercospora fijiensis CIRAD86]
MLVVHYCCIIVLVAACSHLTAKSSTLYESSDSAEFGVLVGHDLSIPSIVNNMLYVKCGGNDSVPGGSRQQPEARTMPSTTSVPQRALVPIGHFLSSSSTLAIKHNAGCDEAECSQKGGVLPQDDRGHYADVERQTKRPSWASSVQQVTQSVRMGRNMHLNNARQAVLQTAELLEEIFSYLPVIDLWRLQRVSKQFLELTVTSPRINSAMLLTPDPELPRSCWKARLSSKTSTYETVVSNHAEQSTWVSGWPEKRRTPAQLAPILKLREDQMMRPDDVAYRTNSAWRLQYWADEQVRFKVRPDLAAIAPWEDCFVTNPACFSIAASIRLTVRHHGKEYAQFRVTANVKNDDGIKVGEILRSPMDLAAGMEWWDDGRYFRKPEVVPSQIIAKVEKKFRCKAELDIERSWFILNGMVVPCEGDLDKTRPGLVR